MPHLLRRLAVAGALLTCLMWPGTAVAQAIPPDPSVPAPFVPVGRLVIHAVDHSRGDRPVDIDVWYRATQATFDTDVIDLTYASLPTGAYSGAGFAPGPHPLVLFSHATYSDRFQSFSQMETIASNGFVAAAPTHEGHTLTNEVRGTTVGFGESMNDRLADLAFTKLILDGDENGPGLLTSIIAHDSPGDPRLAVMGHSLGAVSALQMSDGANDTAWGVNHPPDLDVDAVIAVAPALMFHTPDYYLPENVPDDPLLILGGSADTTAPLVYSQQLWDAWDTLQKFRVDMAGVNHAAPSNGCDILDALAVALWGDPGNVELARAVDILAGRMDGACAAPHPDRYIVNRTVQAFAVPFLMRTLKGDQAYETWLSRARSNRSTLVPNDYWRCTPPAGVCDTAPS